MRKHIIKDIVPGSIAEEMEIEPGDYLVSINDEEIKDILDYKFQIFDEYITLVIEKKNGEEWDLEIEKEANEDLGIIFPEQLIEKPRSCANKCIFCFMDQLPDKVRNTLVFKDDDFRLSFSICQDIQFMANIPKSLSIQDISHKWLQKGRLFMGKL